jgi:hypothetical protein
MMRTYRGLTPDDLDRMPADRFLMLLPWDELRKMSSSGGMNLTQAQAVAAKRRQQVEAFASLLLDELD